LQVLLVFAQLLVVERVLDRFACCRVRLTPARDKVNCACIACYISGVSLGDLSVVWVSAVVRGGSRPVSPQDNESVVASHKRSILRALTKTRNRFILCYLCSIALGQSLLVLRIITGQRCSLLNGIWVSTRGICVNCSVMELILR